MRYDTEHKARTRERVLKEAAEAIRAEGAERVGVAAIMARAGLTHGGFYAHFKSKDDLIAQAIGQMFEERYAFFLSRLDTRDPRGALTVFIDRYLSMAHRDAPERGCPIPSLASEIVRLPDSAREAFTIGVARLTDGVATLLANLSVDDPAALASSTVAEMIGSLSLARAQSDEDRAGAILAASRSAVKKRLGIDETD